MLREPPKLGVGSPEHWVAARALGGLARALGGLARALGGLARALGGLARALGGLARAPWEPPERCVGSPEHSGSRPSTGWARPGALIGRSVPLRVLLPGAGYVKESACGSTPELEHLWFRL